MAARLRTNRGLPAYFALARGSFCLPLRRIPAEGVCIMLFLIFSVLLYFLPTIIARDKPDATAIFLVNLLFGWTIICWFVALICACAYPIIVPVVCSTARSWTYSGCGQ